MKKDTTQKPKSLGDQLLEAIETNIGSLKIWNQPKRVTDKHGNRDWAVRLVYEAEIKGEKIESEWEGFKSIKPLIKDLLKKVNKIKG